MHTRYFVGACSWFLITLLPLARSECPRGSDKRICSGVGECDIYSRCVCSAGFYGPNCALRTCPSAKAWSSPAGTLVPNAGPTRGVHDDAICSARGVCHPETGRCECQFGFEGAACERMSCPTGISPEQGSHAGHAHVCSGRGLCTNLERLAAEFNFWESPRPAYNEPWDKDKVYGCLCDPGFFGYDCSLRECPVGGDPLARWAHPPSKAVGGPSSRSSNRQAWRDTETRASRTANSRQHVWADFNEADRKPRDNQVAAAAAAEEGSADQAQLDEIQLLRCVASEGHFTLRLGTKVPTCGTDVCLWCAVHAFPVFVLWSCVSRGGFRKKKKERVNPYVCQCQGGGCMSL